MASPEDLHKRDEDEGESGQGGQAGQIEFHDFIGSGGETRDDLLSPEEKKRLLSVHQDLHEAKVKKQKDLREQRQSMKEGKNLQQGNAARQSSEVNRHPILADKAQFSGMDDKVNMVPTENTAETNNEKREELHYQYQLKYQPDHAPRMTPKPQFPR